MEFVIRDLKKKRPVESPLIEFPLSELRGEHQLITSARFATHSFPLLHKSRGTCALASTAVGGH